MRAYRLMLLSAALDLVLAGLLWYLDVTIAAAFMLAVAVASVLFAVALRNRGQ